MLVELSEEDLRLLSKACLECQSKILLLVDNHCNEEDEFKTDIQSWLLNTSMQYYRLSNKIDNAINEKENN